MTKLNFFLFISLFPVFTILWFFRVYYIYYLVDLFNYYILSQVWINNIGLSAIIISIFTYYLLLFIYHVYKHHLRLRINVKKIKRLIFWFIILLPFFGFLLDISMYCMPPNDKICGIPTAIFSLPSSFLILYWSIYLNQHFEELLLEFLPYSLIPEISTLIIILNMSIVVIFSTIFNYYFVLYWYRFCNKIYKKYVKNS